MSTVANRSTVDQRHAVDRIREDDLVDVWAPEGAVAWEESLDGFLTSGWVAEDPDEIGTDYTRVAVWRTEDSGEGDRIVRNVPRGIARSMWAATEAHGLKRQLHDVRARMNTAGLVIGEVGRQLDDRQRREPVRLEDDGLAVDALTCTLEQIALECPRPVGEILAEALDALAADDRLRGRLPLRYQ